MIKYLKTRWKTGVLALLMVAVTAGILFLYDIPLEVMWQFLKCC